VDRKLRTICTGKTIDINVGKVGCKDAYMTARMAVRQSLHTLLADAWPISHGGNKPVSKHNGILIET